jgi:hypothetical protein
MTIDQRRLQKAIEDSSGLTAQGYRRNAMVIKSSISDALAPRSGRLRGRCYQCGWKRAGACGRWNIALISMLLNPAWMPLSIGIKISLVKRQH